jgi:lysozyme
MADSLREMLLRHEGLRLKPYVDTVGKLTIGVGRNLTDNGISQEEADLMFENDVKTAIWYIKILFPEHDQWTQARQDALTDMMYNIGPARFSGFKKMIAAVKLNDWAKAAAEMKDSLWATQVPARVEELANMVEQG